MLEAKFFGLFRVLYLVRNQAYKLELPKKQKIHNIFHVSLLEYNIIRKKQVDKITIQLEFKAGDYSKKDKVKGIRDTTVYVKESEGYLPNFYYLVLQKDYPKEKNT